MSGRRAAQADREVARRRRRVGVAGGVPGRDREAVLAGRGAGREGLLARLSAGSRRRRRRTSSSASVELQVNAGASVLIASPSAGPDVIVVSGGVVSTVNDARRGRRLGLLRGVRRRDAEGVPAVGERRASCTARRTRTSRSASAASIEQREAITLVWLAVNSNVGVLSFVSATFAGPAVIVVSGATAAALCAPARQPMVAAIATRPESHPSLPYPWPHTAKLPPQRAGRAARARRCKRRAERRVRAARAEDGPDARAGKEHRWQTTRRAHSRATGRSPSGARPATRSRWRSTSAGGSPPCTRSARRRSSGRRAVNDDMLLNRRSLSPADRLELEVQAIAGVATRLGIPLDHAELARLIDARAARRRLARRRAGVSRASSRAGTSRSTRRCGRPTSRAARPTSSATSSRTRGTASCARA